MLYTELKGKQRNVLKFKTFMTVVFNAGNRTKSKGKDWKLWRYLSSAIREEKLRSNRMNDIGRKKN